VDFVDQVPLQWVLRVSIRGDIVDAGTLRIDFKQVHEAPASKARARVHADASSQFRFRK
jgi:hypothetical protein